MIDAAYRDAYAQVFREMLAAVPGGQYDESALPSYTHGNPAMAWLFWRRLDAAFALAGDVSGCAVLDFGCGGAVTFRYLAARGCRIAGCDPEAQELAREVCRRLSIDADIRAGIEDFAGRRFDRILALDVLEHIEDLDPYLGQFAAQLPRDGRLVVSGPTENWLYRLGRQLAGFSGHYHVRNIYDIEDRLAARGFRRLGIETLYPGVPLFRVSAWAPPPAQ